MSFIKYSAILILLLFSGYTVYCSRQESFIKSARTVFALRWGRQVTIDLYIGLLLFCFFIYLNEASVLITLLWLIPTLILGNIVPLIYFIFNFDLLVNHFI